MSAWTMTDEAAGKPKFLTTAEKANTYGVDTTELKAGADSVVSASVLTGGSGYPSAPVVTIAGSGGSGATATATLANGKVTGITITNSGNGYPLDSTVSVAAPTAHTFDTSTDVDTSTEEITLTAHSFESGDQVTYSDGGGTEVTGLTDAETYFVNVVDANTVTLALTAGGVAIDLTANGVGAAHTLTGETATASPQFGVGGNKLAHAGWVKVTKGTGNRKGRIQYETLVATSGITGDDTDDVLFPDT